MPNKTDTTDFERGVIAAKQAIADKIKDMACYFDKFETYSGRYGSSHGRESLNPDEIAKLITDVEVSP